MKIDEVIPAKGHDYSYKSASSTEPTCTESGRYKGTCPVCGKDYNDTIPALGHDWGEWVTTIEPTYTTVGYRYHLCARCNTREGEDIPKLHTHTWDAGVVTQKPTATEPGVLYLHHLRRDQNGAHPRHRRAGCLPRRPDLPGLCLP